MALLTTLKAMSSRRAQKAARFLLRYGPPRERPIIVGHLEFDGRMWTFWYDDEYKERADLRPIEGFDDVDRVYQSSVLFPFFAVRVPDIDRDDVRRTLEAAHVRRPEVTDLLRMFGRRVVSSPAFELLPA
jgi:hypothetical protein